VAFGAWPPLFHILLAGWMMFFHSSSSSVLLFTSLLGAVLAAAVFAIARTGFTGTQALALGTVVAVAPAVQELSAMVMADLLHALFCTCAIYALAHYLKTRRPWLMLACGVATAAALLTKNNAVLLGVAIPLTVVLTRAWWVLRRKVTWLAAGIVVVVAGSWEIWALRWVLGLMIDDTTGAERVRYYSQALLSITGAPIAILAAIGLGVALVGPLRGKGPVPPIYAASASLVAGTWIFHVVLKQETYERYMLPALPAAVILAALGLEALVSRLPAWSKPGYVAAILGFSIVGWQGFAAIRLPRRGDSAYPYVAQRLLQLQPADANQVILISSERNAEGLLIEEVASRERPLNRWILRGTKVLSRSGWHLENYRIRFSDNDALLAYLRSVPVDLIVLDPPNSGRPLAHHRQLAELIERHPDDFEPVLRTSPGRNCRGEYCAVEVFRLQVPDRAKGVQLGVGAKEMIGRKLFRDWDMGPPAP
jgi:4-amino-4-deoxy-L-arabinose transferase-like glycosyltransferase